jgi:anaerobic selenocysteine-containing dehydrogenase
VLFADRRFPTPSGRVQLIRDADPAPPRPSATRPLLLMAISTDRAQASQWAARDQSGFAEAVVHPAAAAGVAEGSLARLESEIASITVRVRFDAGQRTDVVLMDKGGWHHAGRSANALVPAAATDAGGGAVFYDTPVRLVPVETGGAA